MVNMRRQTQRNSGWKRGKECQENYKKMDGSLDGSRGKVKMDPSVMQVDIGKHESSGNGTNVQIYLENLTKMFTTPKTLDVIKNEPVLITILEQAVNVSGPVVHGSPGC